MNSIKKLSITNLILAFISAILSLILVISFISLFVSDNYIGNLFSPSYGNGYVYGNGYENISFILMILILILSFGMRFPLLIISILLVIKLNVIKKKKSNFNKSSILWLVSLILTILDLLFIFIPVFSQIINFATLTLVIVSATLTISECISNKKNKTVENNS